MVNRWIKHVQAYAKQHKLKYGDAISKARATYKADPAAKGKRAQRKKAFFASQKRKK